MSNKKRRMQLRSSDEEEEEPNEKSPRKSVRLKRKFQRSHLVIPSRNKIWNIIPSSEFSPTKVKSPKKTINDFTKVYNTYNFDDYEDSSHDESEGFIDSSNGSASEEDAAKCKSGRVKNFRRRIILCSSSDEDDDPSNINEDKQSRIEQVESNTIDISVPVCENVLDDNVDGQVNYICDEKDSSSSEEMISPTKRPRNASLLESSESEIELTVSETNGNDSDDDDGVESDSELTVSDSNGNYSDDDGVESDSELHNRSSKFKRKRDELFKAFKDVQKQKKGIC